MHRSKSMNNSIVLQITSLLYIIPAFLAWNGAPSTTPVLKYCLPMVVMISYVYHGNYRNTVVKTIDMVFMHGMVLYHAYRGALCATQTWHTLCMYSAIAYSGTVFWLLGLSTEARFGIFWHATIHLTTALGSAALLSSPHCSPLVCCCPRHT